MRTLTAVAEMAIPTGWQKHKPALSSLVYLGMIWMCLTAAFIVQQQSLGYFAR